MAGSSSSAFKRSRISAKRLGNPSGSTRCFRARSLSAKSRSSRRSKASGSASICAATSSKSRRASLSSTSARCSPAKLSSNAPSAIGASFSIKPTARLRPSSAPPSPARLFRASVMSTVRRPIFFCKARAAANSSTSPGFGSRAVSSETDACKKAISSFPACCRS